MKKLSPTLSNKRPIYTMYRAVASIYTWKGGGGGGGGGCRPKNSEWQKKIPNILWHTKPRRCLYPEKEDAIYKQIYTCTYFTHRHITETGSAVGSCFWLGAENEARGNFVI
jgi:hypothetical protein